MSTLFGRCRGRGLGIVLLCLSALVGGLLVQGGGVGSAPFAVSPAFAASEPTSATILIDRGGAAGSYATPTVSITQDGQLSVLNRDTYTHTVTSVATDKDGVPLFDVEVRPGETKAIPSATGLAAGDYEFYCRYHPNMRGTLTVTGGSGGTGGEPQTFDLPLVVPETVTGSDIALDMRQAEVQMLPDGDPTTAWTYGGTWPGPTIRRPAGHRTLVTVTNDLPEEAGSMTMHLHGDHHASRFDGQPTSFLVRRGESRTYRYDLRERGRPEPGSFFFYHDHRMDHTARNNWMGLQGMFIVDNAKEASYPELTLPSGARDVPLMISDRSFGPDNQLAPVIEPPMTMSEHGMAWTGENAPPNDATVGTKILVNGRFAPHLDVDAVHYRLRLLNSSAFSSYDVALSDGRPFLQIGTGDGLLPHPVVRQSILLGPSQRADVIVDFHGETGQDVVLKTVSRPASDTGTGSRIGDLMQFRVGDELRDRTSVPDTLPSPKLVRKPKKVSKTWTFSLSGEATTGSFWAVNGKAYDPSRVDHRVELGTTEAWRLRNTSDVTHYIHLHEEQWRTLSRNGAAPPPWERGLEDTWKLDPGENVVVAAKFTDYTGSFMLHCHMLDHEDHGMMATFKVVR